MAKNKKRKNDKEKFKYTNELIGISMVLLSILGLGRYGMVGKLICCFTVFLVGNFYAVLLIAFLIIGAYLLIMREKPKFFSSRLIGVYIILFGGLIFAHREYVTANNGEVVKIFQVTFDKLIGVFNIIGVSGHGTIESCGGGIIGAVFAVLFNKLFASEGTEIISIVLIAFGAILVTGISVIDVVKNLITKIKIKRGKTPITYEENSNVVKINDSNASEPSNKIVISNINELNTIKDEKVIIKEDTVKTPINNNYVLPDISILNPPIKNKNNNQVNIEANITKLENVLKDFGFSAKVVEVTVGPAFTQYEMEVGSGTRLAKLLAIHREISLALAKKDVRIQAPIPGKSTVGIEIPNDSTTIVYIREIIETLPKSKVDSKLLVGLGKDIMCQTKYMEIDKTPHLLVAGATGSGKSVCINTILASILMRTKPDEVKLMLVDPKKVELSMYNGVPHLIRPVITNPKEAAVGLGKIVQEMEHRYDIFEERGVKNITGYNEYITEKNKTLPKEDQIKKMPYIVVVVDELADLMLVAAKEVEDYIMRITQMARAAGIHLIIATQRPSTDVITGIIKANIPSRISFAVSSNVDSRTILDMGGAEKLLGRGDMLFLPMGENTPVRIQGAWITEEEINRLVQYTINQQKAEYDEKLLNLSTNNNHDDINDEGVGNYNDVSDDDPLYNDIVEFVITTGKASSSLIQRRFKLGYNRAARIVDLLEERGIVGPPNGSKPREVLVELNNDNDE